MPTYQQSFGRIKHPDTKEETIVLVSKKTGARYRFSNLLAVLQCFPNFELKDFYMWNEYLDNENKRQWRVHDIHKPKLYMKGGRICKSRS